MVLFMVIQINHLKILLLVLSLKGTLREKELIYEAVSRSAVTCYTLEGRYPAELQYLIDNYGLVVDSDKYVVSYNSVADNLRPEIFVTVRR